MSFKERYRYNPNGELAEPLHGRETTTDKARIQQPVKLQPSWEENNLPEEELNFKHLTMDEASLQLNTPPDKLGLVYFTFLLHGIGTLMSWNMFINAIDYFTEYKLGENYIGTKFEHSANFMQYLTFCSQIPNVLFNWMNIFAHIGGNLTMRIVWSIGINLVVFIITIIMAMVDTKESPYAFFYVTMISVIILNMSNGVYQNTIYGMAAKLPPKYTGAVVLGNNISGTFASLASIVTKLSTENKRLAAIYYFITVLFVLLIGFDSYFALPLNRFYRHYEIKAKKIEEQNKKPVGGVAERTPYLYVLKKCWMQLFNVFTVFLVTLAVFPSISAGIKRQDDFFIGSKLYTDITCFLTFNVFAMIGSLLPTWFIWPSKRFLWIPVTLRLLYIPFYLLCNYQVDGVHRVLPVVINNDYVYWVVSATMALTSGYFSSVAMMYIPRTIEEKYMSTAGMFGGAFLVSGIFAGILLSFLWPWFIANVGY